MLSGFCKTLASVGCKLSLVHVPAIHSVAVQAALHRTMSVVDIVSRADTNDIHLT